MFHISDIKKFNRCPRLFYLSNNSTNSYQPFLRNDEELTDLVIKYLNLDKYYLGIKGDDANRILQEIDNYDWFVKARFEYKDLRIKIPFLHKVDDGFDIYFALFALYPHDDDLEYYRNNIWVLEANGIKVNDIFIIHLNANYTMEDTLDVSKLFLTSNHFYNIKNNPTSIIKDRIYENIKDLSKTIEVMKNSSLTNYNATKKRACKSRNICEYYYECFKSEQKLEDDSILYLVSSQKKDEMYNNGIRLLKDADLNLLEGNRCQFAQIMASRKAGLYYDYYPLKTWVSNISKPIAFIDFEWERYIVPPYKGMKPYDVMCFEYSLHILDENDKLTHHTFIGKHDCREEFIKSLINDIPKNATILAYNAIGAEILRVKELKDQFPKYDKELTRIINSFKDMSFPFINGLIYHTKMRGNYSVKSLLNVVSDLTYQDLEIHDGMEAVYKWRLIDRDDKEYNLDEIEESLIQYCSLDSYALYLIYKWLIDILESDNSNFVNRHKE